MPTIISTPIQLTFFFSLSFTATSSSIFPPFSSNPNPNSHRRLSLSSPSPSATGAAAAATAADILSLLGTEDQASKIDSDEAQELWSCLKFLVPFRRDSVNRRSISGQRRENVSSDRENEQIWWPPLQEVNDSVSRRSMYGQRRENRENELIWWPPLPEVNDSVNRRSMFGQRRENRENEQIWWPPLPEVNDSVQRRSMSGQRRENRENEQIWWPPVPVLELARLAVDSGGDPDAIYRTLDPTVITVPDVEGSNKSKCELTRTPYGTRFINKELNAYFAFLFELIASRGPSVGLHVSLSRYDFFHGHFFLAKDTGRLGILFHAKEFPAYDKEVFPFNMGYCQKGSDVAYDDSMNLRNILWLAPLPSTSSDAWVAPGVLVVLDAHPGGIIYRDIVPDYVQIARTIYEDDFGAVPMDVNYLNIGGTAPNYQIFIC